MDIFEAINTQRAMRRLKPDPVPDELIWKLLDAAVKAPSGGNRQPWSSGERLGSARDERRG